MGASDVALQYNPAFGLRMDAPAGAESDNLAKTAGRYW